MVVTKETLVLIDLTTTINIYRIRGWWRGNEGICVSDVWLYKALSISRGIISSRNSEETLHMSPIRTSYGMSFVGS